MLAQRIITATLLLIVFIAALTYAAPWGFALLAGAFVLIGLYEYLQLLKRAPLQVLPVATRSAKDIKNLAAHGCALLLLMALGSFSAAIGNALIALAAGIWVVLALQLVFTRGFYTPPSHLLINQAMACILLSACWIAVVQAYAYGVSFLVSILLLVWIADIAAYFVGRSFGRHQLAPTISPGKTWEGALGAIFFVMLIGSAATIWPIFKDSFFSQLMNHLPLPIALLSLLALTAISIVGDLFESHLKRQAGVKDSGQLLPGHGGVLDRIDALLPVMPMAMLMHAYL